jgi:hypothetical protein
MNELTPEQLARLNPDQLRVVRKRELEKKERAKLIENLRGSDAEQNEMLFNALRASLDDSNMECEHGRSLAKPCIACHEIEVALHPEAYDEDGNPIDE